MRDALIGQVVEAVERRGHSVLKVNRVTSREKA